MAGEFVFDTVDAFAAFRRDQVPDMSVGDINRIGRELDVLGQSPASGFEINDAGVRYMFEAASKAGPRAVVRAVNFMAVSWLREIKRHCPVDTGLLRQSFQIRPASLAMARAGFVQAVVGTNVPYARYIEFGNPWIASGALRAWAMQNPPILDWPAKRRDAIDLSKAKVGKDGKYRDSRGKFLKSTDINSQEFMPPMRGSWQQNAPKWTRELAGLVVAELRKVAEKSPGLADVANEIAADFGG